MTTTTHNTRKTEAPEGGWGWCVVFAYALNNTVVLPTIMVFGLLYDDLLLNQLKFSAVEISVIISLNCSCGMLLAIFNGPILRKFGFRKVAVGGSMIIFVANALTSCSTRFWHFVLFFGVILSIGMNFTMAAFHLALNTYFVEKRGMATGIAMSITGLGPILMPLFVSFLITVYSYRGAGLLLAAVSFHSLIGALLLQPVKWHRRRKDTEFELQSHVIKPVDETDKLNDPAVTVIESEKENQDELQSTEEPNASTKLMQNDDTTKKTATESDKNLTDEEKGKFGQRRPKSLDDVIKQHEETVLERLIRFFDFDLLKDPIYINISLGLSLAFFCEMNFSMMLPFILKEQGFVVDNVAVFMSVLAVADIIFRFISPFFGKSIKSNVRVVYLSSLMSGIVLRICLIYSNGYYSTMLVIFALGMTKGLRTVYTSLVIPTYVPLKKLASATGLQMVNNGVFFLIFGPIMGFVKKKTPENYHTWIHVLNWFTLATVCMWFTEMYLLRKRKTPDNTFTVPVVTTNTGTR